jgi:DNA-binding transcriptional ArsR family regulator
MDAFSALAQPKRREIVQLLARNGSMNATQISSHFQVTPQAMSQHLKILLEYHVIRMQRTAQMRLYSVNSESIKDMAQWANSTLQLWDKRLDSLDKLLEAQKKKKR